MKSFRIPYGISILKFIILSCAFYTLYIKIHNFQIPLPKIPLLEILMITFLSFCNWGLEVFKWQILVRSIRYISYSTAFSQSLAAHTTAIITPNKIGEYGAKASFFKKELRKKILSLTFIGNASQMLITCIFGCVGIALFKFKILNHSSVLFISIFCVLGITVLYYLQKTKNIFKYFYNTRLSTHVTVLILSLLRYLVFSFQYVFLLKIIGIEQSYTSLLPIVWLLYFISSCIPSFALFDFAIKGSVALFIFDPFNISNEIILITAFLMWLLNFAIPAIIGGFFITGFNLNQQLK
ncbi:hypothetical protein [Flavicella sp.]|uniref:hypothetical protein n=1 Tax=Flavicella sp. TaxID=2957742 RepID=UPI00301A3046